MSSEIAPSSSNQSMVESLKKLTIILVALFLASVCNAFCCYVSSQCVRPQPWLSTIHIISAALMLFATFRLCFLSNVNRIVNICAGVLCLCEVLKLLLIRFPDMTIDIIVSSLIIVLLSICLFVLGVGIRNVASSVLFSLTFIMSIVLCLISFRIIRCELNLSMFFAAYWFMMLIGTLVLYSAIRKRLNDCQQSSDQNEIEEIKPDASAEKSLEETLGDGNDKETSGEEGDEETSDDKETSGDEDDDDLPEVHFEPNYGGTIRITAAVILMTISTLTLFGIPIAALLYFILFKPDVPSRKVSLSKKGFTCNKIKPNTLSWNEISDIDFDLTTKTILFAIPILTYAKVKITTKDAKKRRLTLYFGTQEEALQSCLTIQIYYSKYK